MPAPVRSPSKGGKSSSSSSSRPSSSSSSASSTKLGSGSSSSAPKKMGTLSSFQATLNFSKPPAQPISGAGPSRPSSSSSTSSAAPTQHRAQISTASSRPKLADKDGMPPPPVPSSRSKGKSKATFFPIDEVIEIDSDDDEKPETTRNRKRSRNSNSTSNSQGSSMLWSDEYAPEDESELAPGKARIAKIKAWLHEAVYGGDSESIAARDRIRKYRRILVVHGPAGVGKTTTLRLVARQMGVELVEWTDGVEEYSIGSGFERESASSKLSSFLTRNAYPSLDPALSNSSRALLLTSLPNLSHLPTRDQFHASILEFCKSYTPSSCPLVIVHSDMGSGGRAEASWMDSDRGGREGMLEILGKEVRDGPWCQTIEFLPLAQTFLVKALNRVLDRAVEGDRRPAASAVQLIALSANGDLRSAINSLQLLCTKSTAEVKKKRPAVKASGKGSRGGKGAKLDVSSELRAVLDAVTRREQSLNLFHALGKVFYNKRLGDPENDNDDQEEIASVAKQPLPDPLPAHLARFDRRPSMVQMDAFAPIIPVDSSSFTLWIHQSLPHFCNDIEQVGMALDDFCAADVMKTDDDIWQSSPQAIAYALHLTVRGSLMALPSPVPRRSQKVVKPLFFEAFRTERDSKSLLDSAAGYLAKKSLHSANAWGGVSSHLALATEIVPLAMKIQSQSNPILPISAQPLVLAPFTARSRDGPELDSRSGGMDEEEFEETGEEGTAGQGWAQEEIDEEQGDEDAWMEEDDIQEWD